MEELPSLLSEYHPKDIFNADECVLFSQLTPRQNTCIQRWQLSCEQGSKDIITLLVYAKMDGTKKMLLLVTGKSEKPRCFKQVNFLPCK
jgi:hypothetical protein